MNKKFVEKFTAVISAACMISVGIASVNAAEIDDGFESVTKNAQSSDSSFPSAYSAIGYSLVDENGLPSNFSSKKLGFVTPIKAQQYNDCWAVAGTEGFETKLLKLGYPVTEMSHDHANASSTTQTNGKAGRENTVTADLQIFIPAISPHGRAVQRLPMSVRLIFQKIFTAMI
ncbi:hypothetical protein DWY59_07335 [Ruminococcus bromii]|nr:hypothetical protein DWY59_07335 [Ruminococcus bromii]